MRIRSLAPVIGALSAALLLAGCASSTPMPNTDMGSGGSMMTSSSNTRNAADEMFTVMMIPHHQQAVEMSDLILGKSDIDSRVRDLAQQIKDAQAPEIDLMKSWLSDWGMPWSDSMADGMAGMDHGGGMMSADDMDALSAATGASAAKLYLEGMITHHEGAVSMAQSVVADGENAEVIALANRIIASQTEEIATMKALLASL